MRVAMAVQDRIFAEGVANNAKTRCHWALNRLVMLQNTKAPEDAIAAQQNLLNEYIAEWKLASDTLDAACHEEQTALYDPSRHRLC